MSVAVAGIAKNWQYVPTNCIRLKIPLAQRLLEALAPPLGNKLLKRLLKMYSPLPIYRRLPSPILCIFLTIAGLKGAWGSSLFSFVSSTPGVESGGVRVT